MAKLSELYKKDRKENSIAFKRVTSVLSLFDKRTSPKKIITERVFLFVCNYCPNTLNQRRFQSNTSILTWVPVVDVVLLCHMPYNHFQVVVVMLPLT